MTDLDKLNILTLINLALDHLEAAEGESSRYHLLETARLLKIAFTATEKIINNINTRDLQNDKTSPQS